MRAFFGVIVLLLLFAAEGSAFTPGPTIIRECPRCRVPVEQDTMASGNTFGARFWSDGKMGAPMLPDYPWLVKCPKCKHLFWIDEAKKLGDDRKGWKGQGKVASRELDVPTVSDFCRMVARVRDKKKQRYIRTHLWHCANDRHRGRVPIGKVSLSVQTRANMTALSRLMIEKNPEDRLTKAEIARELGEFDRCIKLLNSHFDKQLSATASAIRMLAQERYAPVFEFSPPRYWDSRTGLAKTKPTDVENRLFVRALKESCVYVANGMLSKYRVDALLLGEAQKLKTAIAAGAAKGNDSAVAVVLNTAALEGSPNAAGFLVDCGARVNGSCGDWTPLMKACLKGHENVASVLIDKGAGVDAPSVYGLTPLVLACRERFPGLAKLLLDRAAKVDQADGGDTPLMTLCGYSWDRPQGLSNVDLAAKTLEMIKLLIDHGANVDGIRPAADDDLWSTPLIEICQTEFSEDESAPDRYTKAQKAACESIYLDIVRLLLDSNADINKCDCDGGSPLAHACRAGNVGVVKLLLDRGADVNKASNDGTTPLSIAQKLPDKTIENLLLERGAKPKAGK